MSFDLDTLFFATVFTSAIAGCLLLLTWLQNRDTVALALWGAGFVLGSAGLALITLRGVAPDIWSIVIGNAILAIAYGIGWLGVRAFEGLPGMAVVLLLIVGIAQHVVRLGVVRIARDGLRQRLDGFRVLALGKGLYTSFKVCLGFMGYEWRRA